MPASSLKNAAEAGDEPALAVFTSRLGYRFRDPGLLVQALTHRSHAFENGTPERHNENLEFLGDAVLGMVAAAFLFQKYPEEDEGFLSRVKSLAISRTTLARIGRGIGIGPVARIGIGEERSGARTRDSLLADMVEAVIGAVFLDGGFEGAAELVTRLISNEVLAIVDGRVHGSARTELQEYLQKDRGLTPEYRLISESGPDNDKLFRMEVLIEGKRCGIGSGRTKKDASQEAALVALAALTGNAARAPHPVSNTPHEGKP